jgi:hypothetical protein
MSSAGEVMSPITFTFEYEGHGWAHASISDGAETYDRDPSYVFGDPLFRLVQAVVELLRNGDGHAGCEWWYEPPLDRWDLHRQGDTLHITIRGRRDGTPSASAFTPLWFWSSEAAGEVQFRTTCDLWAFAEQVRRAVRQLKPIADDDRYHPRWLRRTVEYRTLREFLDEHERAEGQLPSRRRT